jgi:N-acetylglucosaminyldiphosphoundecaprenol N-acetyl-beta-D-mannosaminyltransferase
MRMVSPEDVLSAVKRVWNNTTPAATQSHISAASATGAANTPRRRVNILGVPVDDTTFDEMLDRIDLWVKAGGAPRQIATANPEFVIAAQGDVNFFNILQRAHLVTPDGIGLLYASRILGDRLRQRVTGSDGVPLIAARAAREGWRLFFLGAAPGVAERAAALLKEQHLGLKIVGCYAGDPSPEAEDDIVAMIRAAGADVLCVAYGAPAQDKWIARNLPRLGVDVAIGVGGAFDFIVGVTTRAPGWVQSLGLEWLDRLVREPWRWRRQMRLPRFVIAVLLQRLRKSVH